MKCQTLVWTIAAACLATGSELPRASQSLMLSQPRETASFDSSASTAVNTPLAYVAYVNKLDNTAVPLENYENFGHPIFPSYQVRVKRTRGFCDSEVKVYTGYLDVKSGARHLFFYFFESRRNPDFDPVVMCVGAGFSYAEFSQTVETTEEAAEDVQAFLSIFFEAFGRFRGREFHLASESYGGRYIPVFAAEILDQNHRAEKAGFVPINLKSVMIGNGVTEFKTMYESYYDMQCKNVSIVPAQDISKCVLMQTQLRRCMELFQTECIDRLDRIGCTLAASYCDSNIYNSFFTTGRDPNDMSMPCAPDKAASFTCYTFKKHITEFLDLPEIRKVLGVDSSVGNFTGCSEEVSNMFYDRLDLFHPTQDYVSGLLERGIQVLIYAGTYDYVCNWLGNYNWVTALDWTGRDKFHANQPRDWLVDGQAAGFVRSGGGLTFATVKAAGHMVPYDKPKESMVMVNRWLSGSEL